MLLPPYAELVSIPRVPRAVGVRRSPSGLPRRLRVTLDAVASLLGIPPAGVAQLVTPRPPPEVPLLLAAGAALPVGALDGRRVPHTPSDVAHTGFMQSVSLVGRPRRP